LTRSANALLEEGKFARGKAIWKKKHFQTNLIGVACETEIEARNVSCAPRFTPLQMRRLQGAACKYFNESS